MEGEEEQGWLQRLQLRREYSAFMSDSKSDKAPWWEGGDIERRL